MIAGSVRSAFASELATEVQPSTTLGRPQGISIADEATKPATLTIDGRQYELVLVQNESLSLAPDRTPSDLTDFQVDMIDSPQMLQASPIPTDPGTQIVIEPPVPVDSLPAEILDLNLPSALAMVGADHPVVGFAQWRVKEAYAQLAQARALWLPSIQAGFSFHRHDGNYQASDGRIVDVNRNSFQYGFGTGAAGAGTTPRPGLVARFHLADAIFRPKVAQKTAWASSHRAKGAMNTQLRDVAQAYNALVGAHQNESILKQTLDRTLELSKITADFADAGEGLQADADRLRTEAVLVETRLVEARERVAVASARLAQAISLDASQTILPTDVTAVPLELVSSDVDQPSLIGTGLATRPELSESKALVAAACEAYRREKYAPFVPSVLLGFSTGGFGGGLDDTLDDVSSRFDIDALMSWEVRNLGLGEKAARQRRSAQVQQAKYVKLQVMDQVAREVSEAFGQVHLRRERMQIAENAIGSAQASYDRNLERIKDGQGLPLEVLQSVQAMEQASRAYLDAVIGHNESQFQLQWALGWPVNELP